MTNRGKKRALSLALTLALLLGLLPAAALAEEPAPPVEGEIAAFAALPGGVAEQTVPLGTGREELNLPDALTATVYRVRADAVNPVVPGPPEIYEDGEAPAAEPVTEEVPVAGWDSEPAYDGETAGEYVFTPPIEGLTLSPGLEPPAVTVTVEGAALLAALPEDGSGGLDLTAVTADGTYAAGDGLAIWDYDTKTLTLRDAVIENTGGVGVWLPDGSTVAVEGTCAVSGANFGLLSKGSLTVAVGENASLAAGGNLAGLAVGYGPDGILADRPEPTELAVTVAEGGSLAATGGYGVANGFANSFGESARRTVAIENRGTLTASGGDSGVFCRKGSVSLTGGGLTLCTGDGYGVWAKEAVDVAEEVRGLAAGVGGGLSSATGETHNRADGFLVRDAAAAVSAATAVDAGDKSGGLDLRYVKTTTCYPNVGGGWALWEYDGGDGPSALTLFGAVIENTGGIGVGVYLPAGSTVAVEGDCTVSGVNFGLLSEGSLTVEVGENASLAAAGGNYAGLTVGYNASGGQIASTEPIELAVTVAEGGSLTATGKYGVANGFYGSGRTVAIENGGTLTASGGSYGVYCAAGSVSLTGGGLTLCTGDGYGVWAKGAVEVTVEVRGLAAGGSGGLYARNGPVDNQAAAFSELQSVPSPETLEILKDLLASGADLGTVEVRDGTEGLDLSLKTGNATYLYPENGVAHWNGTAKALALTNVTIAAADATGIFLPDGASVTADGTCSVTGGSDAGRGKTAIWGEGGLTVTVLPGASLTAAGGEGTGTYGGGHGVLAAGDLTLQVWDNAALTAVGGESQNRDHLGSGAIANGGTLTLENEGRVTAWGRYGLSSEGAVILRGSGVALCAGVLRYGIAAYNSAGGSIGPGAVSVEAGRLVCAGGISTLGGTVEIASGVTGLIAGNVNGTLTDQSGGGVLTAPLAVFDRAPVIVDGDPAAPLNLTTTDPTLFVYPSGEALWAPGAPAKLTVGGNGLFLQGGVTLPANTAVDVFMGENTAIENGTGPAITAPGGTLTFFTPCMDENSRPSIHGDAVGQMGIYAIGGSVAFTGGAFQLFGKGGASNAPITVRGALGSVEMQTETDAVPAAPAGVTVDPAEAVSREARHAELTVPDGHGSPVHLPGSPSNSAISYNGTAANLTASIAAGTVSEPTPPPPPSGDSNGSGPSTYQVVYRPGYGNGPSPVRDGGYGKGDKVTVRENPFPAPAGKAFAGWSEQEGGAVKYQPGDTLSMPSNTLTLYAVWTEEAEQPGPSLNKTDHIAYLQGYPDGRVGPADLVTREQTAAIFFRLLDADSRARYLSTSSPFPDVADSRWSGEAVATMAKAGILKGLPDGSFSPERPITRAEFAAIAARFDSEAYSGPDLFPDIAGHWAAEFINRAAQMGWVTGGADGLFRPDDPITRAEAAALVNRVLERAPETAEDLLEGMKTFPDNADPTAWYYLDLQEAANGHEYDRKADGVHETWTGLD